MSLEESQVLSCLPGRTTQAVQGFFRIGVSVTTFANVVGLQLNAGPDGLDRLLTGLQTNARK